MLVSQGLQKLFQGKLGVLRILLVVSVVGVLYHWLYSGSVDIKSTHSHDLKINESQNEKQGLFSKHGEVVEWKDEITPEFLKKLDESTLECEDYVEYSRNTHLPLSAGIKQYPFMRPPVKCRTFTSQALETLIADLKRKIKDPDLARLVENCLPNTLDTTILWHKSTETPETFVVTGDIHAEWLRDSARQLSVFQPLIKYDERLKTLIKGAINTQSDYVNVAPYCNAFHPPLHSDVKKGDPARDSVFPAPDLNRVFECKYEIDSLASFLTLTNEYLVNSDFDMSVITPQWLKAYEKVLAVLQRQSVPSFNSISEYSNPLYYSFQRQTNSGSETLPLAGTGNPVNFNTGLVRSAFRPSDDATILQFFVPGNAHMLSELKNTMRNVFNRLNKQTHVTKRYAEVTQDLIQNIQKGLKKHAVVKHPKWGNVYAYEVDGYGGNVFMDDANIPSLLSLPEMGLVKVNDKIYQNTRKMILSKEGNPYYLKGPFFEGIGGPHIGIENAWPMSHLVRIRTTNDDAEILRSLKFVMDTTGGLGLMHESVNVNKAEGKDYTRPWFAWCNSEFGKTILHLATHKPHLIFKDEFAKKPYNFESVLGNH